MLVAVVCVSVCLCVYSCTYTYPPYVPVGNGYSRYGQESLVPNRSWTDDRRAQRSSGASTCVQRHVFRVYQHPLAWHVPEGDAIHGRCCYDFTMPDSPTTNIRV